MARKRPNYRFATEGLYERIPGPGRRYREIATGRVVTRYYVEHHVQRVRLTFAEKRKRTLRGKSAHMRRVITFREHQNREAYYRNAPPDSYWGISDVETDQEFINMELLLHAYDEDIRGIADDYFQELEDEYEYIQWGDS